MRACQSQRRRMLSPPTPGCYTRKLVLVFPDPKRVHDPAAPNAEDAELRVHVEQALSATYELDREIGRGGMGIVYRARDKRLKRHVAIKLLPPELSFRREVRSRFLREAETAAQLSHPNIVPIYSVDEVGNLVFFVMACIDGDNLATKLQKRGPLPIEDVRRWLQEVSDALAYAHARGVVHRDIKPDNILLDGIDGRALVTDFGIARAASDHGETSRLTATGVAIGTPAYMSPEQASGDRDLDARSDLYSLGIVAYQMLCGEPPFQGHTTPALLVKHLAEAPVPISQRRPDVPPDLAAIVMQLLEKDPDHRFQTASSLTQALKTGLVPVIPMGGRGTSVPAAGPFAVPPPGGAPLGGRPVTGMPAGAGTAMGAPSYGGGYQAPAYQSRTLTSAPASYGGLPVPSSPSSSPYGQETGDGISAADWARFEDPRVQQFRRRFALYLIVNTPMLLLSMFGTRDFFGITTLWTVYIAWKYAKLWSDDFDWRDVLRQPRHRMLGEVFEDLGNSIAATFNSRKREELRAQGKLRSRLRGSLSSRPHGMPPDLPMPPRASAIALPVRDEELGPHLELVRGARADRDEIHRLLATLPNEERARIPDVANMAGDLVRTVETVARDLAVLETTHSPAQVQRVEAEITTLEAEANPLDVAGSETRVRRLAVLRRERRAFLDGQKKLETRRAQIQNCRLALENVRLDLVRLRTGASSVQSVTQVAEQAMQMAREVEIAVQAAAEVRDLTSSRSGG